MIITDDFVVLNFKKTGSSFVRAVLKELHQQRMEGRPLPAKVAHRLGLRERPLFRELLLENVGAGPDQHGTWTQIPAEHRHKHVVTALRSPWTRLISQYRFWIQQRFSFKIPESRWREEFPSFPDLSLDDYLRMREIALEQEIRGVPMRARVGHQTVEFVRMFFREGEGALPKLDEAYVASGRFLDDLPEITFLRQEELNRELHRFLLEHGYPEEQIAFILEHQRMNVTRAASEKKDRLWTPAAVERVRESERLLFGMLERLGFRYDPPAARVPDEAAERR